MQHEQLPSRASTIVLRLFALSGLLVLLGCSLADPPAADRIRSDLVESAGWRYALVIDASSSGTGLQIFQWRNLPGRSLPQIEPAPFGRGEEEPPWEIKVRPGLSAYSGEPAEAVRSLEPLIDFALDKLGKDPHVLARTQLFLRATAGMRLLPPARQEEILAALDDYFATLPLAETSARVISGDDEGVFGWIAVNYMLGHLEHGGPFPTMGALDLGGASTQITFVPLDYPRSDGRTVTLGGNSYHLYTHSYLGLGQDQAREKVGNPACFLNDYPLPDGQTGTGELDACREAIRSTFEAECERGPCSLFGAYQPPLFGDFLAFSVYAYAADFFGLNERLDATSIAARGSEFCNRSWSRMVNDDPSLADNPFVPNYCYTAAHISLLLSDGFGFPATTEKITAPLEVQGGSVGWPLGALLFELEGSSR